MLNADNNNNNNSKHNNTLLLGDTQRFECLSFPSISVKQKFCLSRLLFSNFPRPRPPPTEKHRVCLNVEEIKL